MMRKRNQLFQKVCANDPEFWSKYRSLCNKVVSKLGEAKCTYFSLLDPKNYKGFWKAVKYTNEKESCIPTLKEDNSPDVAHTSSEKGRYAKSFLCQMFNHALSPLSLEFLPPAKTANTDFSVDLVCTKEVVCGYLLALDTSKASRSDGFSARMLKRTAVSIAPAVTQLFHISLQSGELPTKWKHALITPIPKSKKLSSVNNY